MWFPTRSDTNRAVQAQKMAGDGKFWIEKVEELYYPCSKNKGADQLRGYREADLRLCFRLCRLLVFPRGGSFVVRFNILATLPGYWKKMVILPIRCRSFILFFSAWCLCWNFNCISSKLLYLLVETSFQS